MTTVHDSFGIPLELISKLFRSHAPKSSVFISLGTPYTDFLKYHFSLSIILGMHMLQCLRRVKGFTNPRQGVQYGKWFKILFYIKISKGLLQNRIEYTYKRLRKKSESSELPQASSSFFFFCLFVFLPFPGPLPMAYGGSQVRGRIGAIAAGLRQSHGNSGSELRLQPTPQLTAMPGP